jgi:hypothetical protein
VIKYWNYLIQVAKIGITVFLVLVFLDVINFTAGNKSFLIYAHPWILNAVFLCIIMEILFLLLTLVELISKRYWKRILVSSAFIVLLLIVCGASLNISAAKGRAKSLSAVRAFFASRGTTSPVKVEKNVEQDYLKFLSKYDPSAIKPVIQSSIVGNYIYVVISEGIEPFIVDMSRSSKGPQFWIYKDGVENALRKVRGKGLEKKEN